MVFVCFLCSYGIKSSSPPPIRLGRFYSLAACLESVIARYEMWTRLDRPFPYFTMVQPFPWEGGGQTY